jgi:glycosyltransferase involved in cell wall biosynthesis
MQMTAAGIAAVAPYGPACASTRERVDRWLSRSAIPARRHYYLGAADAQPRTLLTHPVRTLLAEGRLRTAGGSMRAAVMLLHREATPLSRGDIEVRLLSKAARSIYDLDDALYRDTTGSTLRQWFRSPEKYRRIVAAADKVIAGSRVIADWASDYCGSVQVIPTCVDPDDYELKTDYELGDPPVIGWIGTSSGVRYLEAVADGLLAVHRATGARLEIISSLPHPPPALASFARTVPWSLRAARQRLASWDVGIMPLADEPYLRGKCAYKLLQYCASGLPSVATPVGANADILRRIGGMAPRDDEWCDALLGLLSMSAAGRHELGMKGRSVADDYSFRRWQDVWMQAVLG